jgi:protein involved in polysaccharide export with SLBB domain
MLLVALAGSGFSQEYRDNSRDNMKETDNQPSRYFLGEEENLLLSVNILGMVQKPGQYMVPYRTDLITLVAYAGGFQEHAKISEVKLIRNIPADGKNGTNGKKGRTVVYKMNVKKYFENGDTAQIPQLMPDDTIVVGGSAAKTVDRFFDFVAKGVLVAQLYFLIKVANDN